MRDDRAERLSLRDPGERTPRLRDHDELLGPRARREVVTERERLDGIAGLAGYDEDRAGQISRRACRADRFRIRAVQDVEMARAERFGEHAGDETGPAHAAYEGARQPVGAYPRGERGEV